MFFNPAKECELIGRMAWPRIGPFKPSIDQRRAKTTEWWMRLTAPSRLQRGKERSGRVAFGLWPGGSNDCRALGVAPDHRNSRVGVNLAVKGVGIVHLNDDIDAKCRVDELAEARTILIPHPSIRTNESAHTAFFQLAERCLKKCHI